MLDSVILKSTEGKSYGYKLFEINSKDQSFDNTYGQLLRSTTPFPNVVQEPNS